MFEHTFFTEQYTGYQQEEMERAAARRRMLIEHADQIVPRSPGAVRRMLTRIFRGSTASTVGARDAGRSATNARPGVGHAASERASPGCEPTAAPAR
ncbi:MULTISPECIES: hypothetical protein [unclassified Microbacterium]|uniref:hypothetical protein n=1 Tax=unclassified Microbacterium TaxID=2609290 RepID=UPI0004937785|nr:MULTISPECIES: hypothetical protein [unclassified Microbacterium]